MGDRSNLIPNNTPKSHFPPPTSPHQTMAPKDACHSNERAMGTLSCKSTGFITTKLVLGNTQALCCRRLRPTQGLDTLRKHPVERIFNQNNEDFPDSSLYKATTKSEHEKDSRADGVLPIHETVRTTMCSLLGVANAPSSCMKVAYIHRP